MANEHPAARVVFVPWDFEHEALADLPARLAREGHDTSLPTMTILEGVLMYLTADATDATFECVRRYSSPGSPMHMTYMDKSFVHSRAGRARSVVVRLVGEPFRSGFDPAAVPAFLEARGFRLHRDESAVKLGARLLGPTIGRRMAIRRNARSHFALVRRV
jgi:methyltransferase (TIGR00027 family)